MGPERRAELFRNCPIGVVFLDDEIALLVGAYNIWKNFSEWPPGRRDPRLVTAFVVLQDEHNKMDFESVSQPVADGKG